jgi:hypothetical protein
MRRTCTFVALCAAIVGCSGSGGSAENAADAGNAKDVTAGGSPSDATVSDAPAQGDEGPEDASSADGARGDDAGAATDAPSGDGAGSSDGAGGPGPDGGVSSSPCAAGPYEGKFGGSFTSPLTSIGVPIPIQGTVTMTLSSEGASGTTCSVGGQPHDCGEVFSIQGGRVDGYADGVADGSAGSGLPYACTFTGALDCDARKMVDGWIQCLYCVGAIADGGQACGSGIGGRLAGVMAADYEASDGGAFVNGTWNAAAALAGNDGGSPGPDGGPPSAYLVDGGLYLGQQFGGSGSWNAAHQP